MIYQSYVAEDRPLAVVASSTCADGYDLAKQFTEQGYDLIIAASNPSVVEEAEDFKELGIEAVSFQLDLSTPEGIEQLYRRIVATGRHVEALIINFGMSRDGAQELELADKIFKDMANNGHGRIYFSGCDYPKLKNEALGTGVTISSLNPENVKTNREIGVSI